MALTSFRRGIASRVVPALCDNPRVELAMVVLVRRADPYSLRKLRRKLSKTYKIGVLGALNGWRLRRWYADDGAEDIAASCQRLGVPLCETETVNCAATKDALQASGAALGLSLGNGYIARSVFAIPECGMINIHEEVLPDFRGGSGVLWPIHEGRGETGFAIHQIARQIDAGPILHREQYPIQLYPSLRETVARNLAETRARIPAAFARVCENYRELAARATPQGQGRSYTTPTWREFRRMEKNHAEMYASSRTQTAD